MPIFLLITLIVQINPCFKREEGVNINVNKRLSGKKCKG